MEVNFDPGADGWTLMQWPKNHIGAHRRCNRGAGMAAAPKSPARLRERRPAQCFANTTRDALPSPWPMWTRAAATWPSRPQSAI
jgi:hypothetical protein